jgi:hypothetical protein
MVEELTPCLDGSPVSGWVSDAMRLAQPSSEDFGPGCDRAAQAAITLDSLRRAPRGPELTFLGVSSFLRQAAAGVGQPLEPVLAWARIALDRPADETFSAGWGQIAHTLGLDLRQALLQLRLTLAEQLGIRMVPLLAQFYSPDRDARDVLAECEDFLAREASGWDAGTQARLSACERAMQRSYWSADAAADV